MADPALIRPNPSGEPPGATGSGWTKKAAGLPMWAWVALAAAGSIVGIIWFRSSRSTPAEQGAASTTPADQYPEGLDQEQYESLLALLRDLQGQNSVPVEEPGDAPKPGATPATGPMPTPTQIPSAHPRGYGWYKVVKGDNINTVSKKYGISTATFIGYNGPGALKAGEWVKVRGSSNPSSGYKGK